MLNNKMVKIIATLGPASKSKIIIKEIIKNGADVVRLNFSHGNYDFFSRAIKDIREISRDAGILIDLPGPKIRTGKLARKEIFLKKGGRVVLTSKNIISDGSNIFINYPYLGKDIKLNSHVYIDDGKIKIKVIKKLSEDELLSEVAIGGVLREEKGVNFPDAVLSIPSVTDNDIEFLKFGAARDVDMFAVSFVRKPEDIIYVKNFLKNNYPEKEFLIIAKIEKIEAVKNIGKIAEAADALMVARGDLGVEAPVENIPLEQKKIISAANFYKKPVITATQMLLSMVENESPTRAEVTDISNAIFDGTDSVMLSEETATGKYPACAVRYMSKIIRATEKSRIFNEAGKFGEIDKTGGYFRKYGDFNNRAERTENISLIIAEMTVAASKLLKNSIIIAITRSGYTANLISSLRPGVPILAVVSDERIKRKLSLNFGVSCIVAENIADKNVFSENFTDIIGGWLSADKRRSFSFAVLTGGIPIGEPGSTDFVKIVKIKN